MKIGKNYRWKHQSEPLLVYMGCNWSGNGYWHQFAKVDDPKKEVWCEVTDRELPLIERADPMFSN